MFVIVEFPVLVAMRGSYQTLYGSSGSVGGVGILPDVVGYSYGSGWGVGFLPDVVGYSSGSGGDAGFLPEVVGLSSGSG